MWRRFRGWADHEECWQRQYRPWRKKKMKEKMEREWKRKWKKGKWCQCAQKCQGKPLVVFSFVEKLESCSAAFFFSFFFSLVLRALYLNTSRSLRRKGENDKRSSVGKKWEEGSIFFFAWLFNRPRLFLETNGQFYQVLKNRNT